MALLYQIALTSVWWNDDYQDVRHFNSALEQENYFNLARLFEKAPLINFDIKDLNRPRIVFKEPNKDVFDVLNSNYLIVKDNHASSVQKYFYYFIDRIYQDSGDQYIAECKLDVWQTFHLKADFGSGMIERAHLPRFIYDPITEKATIDFSENSPLLVSEHDASAYNKILKVQEEVFANTISEQTIIQKWIRDNVSAWAYVFVDNSENRKFYGLYSSADVQYKPKNTYYGTKIFITGLEERYTVMFFPIMKTSRNIHVKLPYDISDGVVLKKQITLSEESFKEYLSNNNGYTKIYNVVLSPICPLYCLNSSRISITIDATGNLLIDTSANNGAACDGPYYIEANFGYPIFYPVRSGYALGSLEYPDELIADLIYNSQSANFYEMDQIEFNKSDIVNQNRQIKFEPKFRQAAYTTYTFDIMHLIEKEYNYITNPKEFKAVYSPSIIYNELKIYPDKTRFYTASPDDSFSFNTYQDLSIPIINTQLEQYIANNKTWARIGGVNSESDYDKYAEVNFFSKIVSAVGLKTALNPGGYVGKMIDSANALDLEEHKPQDLKAAPSIVKNSTAAVLRILAQDQVKIYYKVNQVPEATLLRDLDYYFWFGYKYGYYKKFTDILNSSGRRKYFNYILGSFNAISGDINDTARRELRDLIAKGVRIWEVDKPTFDDTKENYEIYFDED